MAGATARLCPGGSHGAKDRAKLLVERQPPVNTPGKSRQLLPIKQQTSAV